MKKIISLMVASAGLGLGAFMASAGTAEITIEKPYFRWLFGGFGFHHSEGQFTALMSEEFLNERVLKTFREISPTFSRVFVGYADTSKEQMDRFADYYHKTFATADTTIYGVPGPMPALAERMDVKDYCEKVAKNLAYLIKKKDIRLIRYYCLTNELMSGDRFAYFLKNMELFKEYNIALYDLFRHYGLDIWLIAPDQSASPEKVVDSFDWCIKNMNDYIGAYCTHWYVYGVNPKDLTRWDYYNKSFNTFVQKALPTNKRYILGEWGFCPVGGKKGVMRDDAGSDRRQPETETLSVLAKMEIGLAAMNQGAYGCVSWSFVDYPDPTSIVDGHAPGARARYESLKCGYRTDFKYNKWGLFRWSDVDKDYSAKAELYAMGYLAKLFRKDATVLPTKSSDPLLRTGTVLNPDGSVSLVIINRGEATEVKVSCAQAIKKPMRMYVYESDNVPHNKFNDLQPHSAVIAPTDAHTLTVKIPRSSATFLTTDYVDRVPSPITDLSFKANGTKLAWSASKDAEHCYYRVFRKGEQVASTVATEIKIPEGAHVGDYQVKSVDKWGNVGKH